MRRGMGRRRRCLWLRRNVDVRGRVSVGGRERRRRGEGRLGMVGVGLSA